jgi:hypothetical protein
MVVVRTSSEYCASLIMGADSSSRKWTYCSMGFVGYVVVCVQLYCRGKLSLFHTTCFGLYGHLQVCRMLLLSCSWRNLLRCFFSVSCTWLRFCRFPYVFSCSIFLFSFSFSCVRVYLLVFSCCLSVWTRAKCNHVQENQRSRFLQEHESNNMLHIRRWPFRPKHVVWNSDNLPLQ